MTMPQPADTDGDTTAPDAGDPRWRYEAGETVDEWLARTGAL